MNAPGQTIALTKTVFHRGRFVREVTMRAPTQAEVDEGWTRYEDPGERGLFLIATVCGLSESTVLKMAEGDKARLVAVFDRITGA